MRRLLLLVMFLSTWSLASCGGESPTATRVGPAAVAARPTATAAPTYTLAPTSPPGDSPTPPVTESPAATDMPTEPSRPTPSNTPVPTATAAPTLPPLVTPVAGAPLSTSLDWHLNGNGHLTAGRIVTLAGRPVYLLSSLGRTVYALSSSGEELWRAQAAGPVYALAQVAGERVAFGDDAGFVTLLDAQGRRLWRHGLGSRVTALHGDWQQGLLAGGWDERLTLLSTEGEVGWQVELEGPVSALSAAPDLALAASLDGKLEAVDAEGRTVWDFDAESPIDSLGTVGKGEQVTILAGTQDGRLIALDGAGGLRWQMALAKAAQGAPVWQILAGAEDAAGAKEAPVAILVGMGGAKPFLARLSVEGEVLWRVSLPSSPGAMATLDLNGDGGPEILVGLASSEIQVYDGQGRLRGSIHAGLPVWGLEAASGSSPADGAALVRADVVAWRLVGVEGPRGGIWLPPPKTVPALTETWPADVQRGDGEAILVFLGDVGLGRTMEAQLIRYGPAYPWEGLAPLLGEADLAMANLEGVLTTQGRPLDKSYLIRAHPRWGGSLVAGGLDLVTLANNHALDYEAGGLDETLDTLAEGGVSVVGAGRSRAEAHQAATFTLNGVRVALLAYAADRWNGSVDVPATERLAWAVPADVQADVRQVRDEADVVVVMLHAGAEYAATPSPDQVAVARAAVDAGADLVVGHHPHVTQTVERYGDGLIVYSLGDAVFDIPRPAAMQGDLLRVHVTREGLIQAELWPFWIEDAIQPQILDDGQGRPRVEIVYP